MGKERLGDIGVSVLLLLLMFLRKKLERWVRDKIGLGGGGEM